MTGMNNLVKYTTGIVTVVLVLYLSLDVQKLDQHKARANTTRFDATDYAGRFWSGELADCIAQAPLMTDVLKTLSENPVKAMESFGKKLGISKTSYFMVHGKGLVESVENEYILLALDANTKVRIATDFIYGNAVRDGSGRVNINDFLNMTDFNAVSVAINKLVKEKVVSRLRKSATVGKSLEFAGAFEISEENVDFSSLLVLPVSVNISDGKSQ
jgi:predicted lipoprotein